MSVSEVTLRVKLPTTSEPLSLHTSVSSTVLALKQQLAPLVHSQPQFFQLNFGEDHLTDGKTLESYHIGENVVLNLEFRQASIRIPVLKANGEATVVVAEGDWTMATLKARVAAQTNAQAQDVKVMEASQEEVKLGDTLVCQLGDPHIAIVRPLPGGF